MNDTTIFVDLETGGVEDRHPNVELAAIAVRDWEEVDRFERRILFDEKECDPEALRLNGYAAERWKDARTEAHVAVEFNEFCTRHSTLRLISKRTGNPYMVARLAGFNLVRFDVPRLQRVMEVAGVRFWKACWWYPLDVYQRALWHFTELDLALPDDFKLQTLATHLGVEPAGRAHEALSDARTCARVARALCGTLPT